MMTNLVTGAIVMACALIGLVFLRYWKSGRDPFFIYLAASFWIQGAQWLHSGIARDGALEYSPYFYLPRLFAYGLIAFAILRKNYGRDTGQGDPRS
jgi:hypothetical protein